MSKKPSKKASRAAAKARPGKAIKTATKRPAAAAETETGRIARALESIAASLNASAAKPSSADSLKSAAAFVWQPNGRLVPVPKVNRVDLGLLRGIDRMRDILIENT
ncbi:MAG TPA: AAA family ATPase, partial [Afipia sp.]|nr:AAA family ATPase [Afipia sp.]